MILDSDVSRVDLLYKERGDTVKDTKKHDIADYFNSAEFSELISSCNEMIKRICNSIQRLNEKLQVIFSLEDTSENFEPIYATNILKFEVSESISARAPPLDKKYSREVKFIYYCIKMKPYFDKVCIFIWNRIFGFLFDSLLYYIGLK